MSSQQKLLLAGPPGGGLDMTSTTPTPDIPSNAAPKVESSQELAVSSTKGEGSIDPQYYTRNFQTAAFTWSTSSVKGQVLFKKEITPTKSFSNIKVLSQMYVFWKGGFEYTFVCVGNNFFGGKAVVAITPPGVDLNKSGYMAYSFYEWEMVDIREPGPISIHSTDQRVNNAHYVDTGGFSDSTFGKLNAYGGTVWFIVLSPLKQASNGSDSIEILQYERLARDFTFMRLKEYSAFGTPDVELNPDIVMNKVFSSPLGPFPHDRLIISSQSTTDYGDSCISFSGKGTLPFVQNTLDYVHFSKGTDAKVAVTPAGDPKLVAKNVPKVAIVFKMEVNKNGSTRGVSRTISPTLVDNVLTYENVLEDPETISTAYATDFYYGISTSTAPRSITPPLKESIVYWAGRSSGILGCLLPTEWREVMLNKYFYHLKPKDSVLYTMRSREDDLPIGFLRLHYMGYFTSAYVETAKVYDTNKFYLQYLSTVPEDQPMPKADRDMAVNQWMFETKHIRGVKLD